MPYPARRRAGRLLETKRFNCAANFIQNVTHELLVSFVALLDFFLCFKGPYI